MKASVDAKSFADVLGKLCRLLKHSSLPLTEQVLVRFTNGECHLTATDVGTWLTARLPSQGGNGSFMLTRPRETAKACRNFDGELVFLLEQSKDGWQVELQNGTRRAVLRADVPELWPEEPSLNERISFQANAASLSDRIEQVRYASAKPGSTRESAMAVQFKEGNIYCLDGYRLACSRNDSLCVPEPFMVRADDLSYLKLFGSNDVTVYIGERRILVSGSLLSLNLHRVEGLNYELSNALPTGYQDEFWISPRDFLQELDFLQSFAGKNLRTPVRFCSGTLSVDYGGGTCQTEVPLDGTSRVVFGFDPRYMADALEQFEKETRVKMKVSGVHSPFVLEAEDHSDYALILPARLRTQAVA